jgi:RHS repeat-associated protein
MGGGVGGLISSNQNGVVRSKHYNSRGDVVTESHDANASSAAAWSRWQFDAFGKATLVNGAESPDRHRANTKDTDPLSGLINDGFRYRDPTLGAFLSRDPAGFIDGPNLYVYVQQNPWTKFDPEGLFKVWPDQPIHDLITIKAYAMALNIPNEGLFGAAMHQDPSI